MILQDLLNLFFPDLCIGCKEILIHQEKHLCVGCLHDLPLTNLHYSDSKLISNIFYGHVVLEHATALFYFPKEGVTRQLIHQLKYKNQRNISSYLGDWLGVELRECNYYNDVDVIIPVPLHKIKLKSRGYNQVAGFGKKIAETLNIDYNDTTLKRIKNTTTQTMKDRLTRLKNLETIFEISEFKTLEGKHILLVDDVITTGATIRACVKELNKIPNIKLSLAVMAYTDN
tara:strand:+ start:2522 stop:3208 length:687 start_codon:yes stop_codon:yes gene_type:complete